MTVTVSFGGDTKSRRCVDGISIWRLATKYLELELNEEERGITTIASFCASNKLPYKQQLNDGRAESLQLLYRYGIIGISHDKQWRTDIIFFKKMSLSVAVSKLQVAILARSSREMSQTVRI